MTTQTNRLAAGGLGDQHGALVPGWITYLRSERHATGTITGYVSRVQMYLRWCIEHEHPAMIDRRQVTEWMADLLESNMPSTVVTKQTAVKQFSRWLADEEGALESDVLSGMRAPHVDEPYIEPLTVEQLQALIGACRTKGRTLRERPFRDVRDEYAVRMLANTGMRAGELVGLETSDITVDPDTGENMVRIRRGKGGRFRMSAFGRDTALALDRWMRKRQGHRLAGTPKILLGAGGKNFGYDALRTAIGGRAEAAEIPGFFLHQLRHTQAHRWLEAGGSESGLMANNGWSNPTTMRRYTSAQKSARAAKEAHGLDLGAL